MVSPPSTPAPIVPSVTYLARFASKRARGLLPSVAVERAQAAKASKGSFGGFYYERLLTGAIEYVNSGCSGRAIEAAADLVHPKWRDSYLTVGAGTKDTLRELEPSFARRHQRSLVALDVDGTPLVRIRPHLVLTLVDGVEMWTHFRGSQGALTDVERAITETALAMAVAPHSNGSLGILDARNRQLLMIDADLALTPQRMQLLRAESAAYRDAWESSE